MYLKTLYLYTLLLIIPNSKFGTTTTTPKINQKNISLSTKQEIVTVFYISGEILIKGLTSIGDVYIYSIIGNSIFELKKQNLSNLKFNVNLKPNNLYIVRIESNNIIRTFKIVAN
tara:strand:- start:1001 stop:1345 length:345 start_codon:yes stop_codon:yes gene_type:complete